MAYFLIPNYTSICTSVCFTVLDEFVYAGLAENLTITALDGTTGKLLGACINVTANKKEIPETLEEYIGHYKVSFSLLYGPSLSYIRTPRRVSNAGDLPPRPLFVRKP